VQHRKCRGREAYSTVQGTALADAEGLRDAIRHRDMGSTLVTDYCQLSITLSLGLSNWRVNATKRSKVHNSKTQHHYQQAAGVQLSKTQ